MSGGGGGGGGKPTKEDLINAAEAAWEAAKHAVPGSEWADALTAVGGCNSLGICVAYARNQTIKCQCEGSEDDPSCKAWERKYKFLQDLWQRECSKPKKK